MKNQSKVRYRTFQLRSEGAPGGGSIGFGEGFGGFGGFGGYGGFGGGSPFGGSPFGGKGGGSNRLGF